MPLNIKDLAIAIPGCAHGGRLDDRHAKPHGDVSPELHLSGVPEGTRELAIICHDPDAPLPDGFTHWTLYGIPPETTAIPEGDATRFRTGPNDFGDTGYGGPMPPEGHGTHHYYFWVYALDTDVEGAPPRREFLDRYADHIIEQNRTVGTWDR